MRMRRSSSRVATQATANINGASLPFKIIAQEYFFPNPIMMPHQENIAEQIKKCIKSYPGLRARDIGNKLDLERSTVNSYLYTKKPPALGNEVYQDSNYGWHLTKASLDKEQLNVGNPIIQESPSANTKNLVSLDNNFIPSPISTQLDDHFSLEITLIEAFQGVHKTIYNGHENVAVYIPPRTQPGTKICIPGKGSCHPSNPRKGNLYCHIDLAPDDSMKLSGNDILCQALITSSLATRGGEVEIQTLDGIIRINISPGVKSGDKLKLKHRGWLNQYNIRGDQYIYLEIIESSSAITKTPKLDEAYPLDVVVEVFRDPDYLELSDNNQAKLAEFLEKARQRQEQEKNLAKVQKTQLLIIITSASFWLAVAVGGVAIYGGLKLIPQFLPPVPLEQPSNNDTP